INLAFDVVLDVFDVLNDETMIDTHKAEVCIKLLLDVDLEDIEAIELWNYVFENFIKVKHEKPIEYDLKGNPMPVYEEEEQEKVIDIEQDAEHIYASFMQAYNMDLYEQQGKLHWHEFKSLLNGLPSNTIMQRIIQIRNWKPSKGESEEYKQSMKRLQQVYELDDEGVTE